MSYWWKANRSLNVVLVEVKPFCTVCLPPIRHVKSVLPQVVILPFHQWLDGVSKSLVRYDFGFHDLNLQINVSSQQEIRDDYPHFLQCTCDSQPVAQWPGQADGGSFQSLEPKLCLRM